MNGGKEERRNGRVDTLEKWKSGREEERKKRENNKKAEKGLQYLEELKIG